MTRVYKYSIVYFLIAFVCVSCGRYNKVFNRGTTKDRYTLANKLYNEGEYDTAIRFYELVETPYASKPQSEVITFRLADSHFKEKDYTTAVYYYEKFIKRFPESTEIGNAYFRIAESYYFLSPKYSVTQTETQNAISAYQNFIDLNASSPKVADANKRIKELNHKLEKKDFEIAKQYYKIGYYKSAIKAFDNVILDHLGTSYKEEAMFYKLKSGYQLATNSIASKKKARTIEDIKIFNRFKKAFPNSSFMKEAESMHEKLVAIQHQYTEQNK